MKKAYTVNKMPAKACWNFTLHSFGERYGYEVGYENKYEEKKQNVSGIFIHCGRDWSDGVCH